MKSIAVVILALACVLAHAQKPLQCGKYQHVDHWPGRCGPSACGDSGGIASSCDAICTLPPPDKCVDDMHVVTEYEWQQILTNTEAIKKSLLDVQTILRLHQKEIEMLGKAIDKKH